MQCESTSGSMSRLTRKAETAVAVMAAVTADASFATWSLFFGIGWFLWNVSIFQSWNSLKQSLFFQADSVKHNWHFGAVEYTRPAFTQPSNAGSALRVSLWCALTFLWLRVPNPQQLTFRPHSAHTHMLLEVWLACRFKVASFFTVRCHSVRYPKLKNKKVGKTLPRCWEWNFSCMWKYCGSLSTLLLR